VLVVLPSGAEPPGDVVSNDVVSFIEGGSTRQESVANALELVTSTHVVVHDAARPLADLPLLERVLTGLAGVDGAIPAVPVDETIKRVHGGVAIETVDRTDLWRAQTPSAFDTRVLKASHERAAQDKFVGTDEGQLVQRYGGTVAVVQGSRMNIKVTYPEDIQLVEAIMQGAR
jgi:2-C-methyl-D-erythritol 4-phosphate cytidylyltransferase